MPRDEPRQFCREEIPGVLGKHPDGLSTDMLLSRLRDIDPQGADFVHVEAVCVELFDAGMVATNGMGRWLLAEQAPAAGAAGVGR